MSRGRTAAPCTNARHAALPAWRSGRCCRPPVGARRDRHKDGQNAYGPEHADESKRMVRHWRSTEFNRQRMFTGLHVMMPHRLTLYHSSAVRVMMATRPTVLLTTLLASWRLLWDAAWCRIWRGTKTIQGARQVRVGGVNRPSSHSRHLGRLHQPRTKGALGF